MGLNKPLGNGTASWPKHYLRMDMFTKKIENKIAVLPEYVYILMIYY